jgi:hypothetical protein
MPYQTNLSVLRILRICILLEATHIVSCETPCSWTTAVLLDDAVPALYTDTGMQRLVMLIGHRLNYATC